MTETDQLVIHAFRTYGNSLLRLSYSYLHNRADAEDVVQDTMLALLGAGGTFENPAHEKAWLMRVAVNQCKNRLKSAWAKTVAIPETIAIEGLDERETQVVDAVHQLPLNYREVVHLYYYEGYSTAEIAHILEKREATVRSLLHRARKLLKTVLEEGGEPDA